MFGTGPPARADEESARRRPVHRRPLYSSVPGVSSSHGARAQRCCQWSSLFPQDMSSPSGTSPPFVRANSPSLGIRRGTVADVRSLSRKAIVIEGWLRMNRGKDAPTRHWFQLDAGPEYACTRGEVPATLTLSSLRAFGSRPFTDAAMVQFAVPLDEVSQARAGRVATMRWAPDVVSRWCASRARTSFVCATPP